VADVPVPRPQLTTDAGALIRSAAPEPVLDLMATLWANGQSAYVVGGSLRDVLLGREPRDWDLGTDALPARTQELFSGAVYENRFGTVGVLRDGRDYEITTLRSDHEYADHRRPHHVEFTDSIAADLARRDFTVNAMAWGAVGPDPTAELIDPYGGIADVRAGVLRAVGDPATRFEEDALRMIRAVRLAASLEFTIESATLDGIRARAGLAKHLSGERIATELERLLGADRPSIGLRLTQQTGLLGVVLPEFSPQIGMAQNKIPGEDLWDHTLRAVDFPGSARPIVRLAALLHDVGKPATESPDGYPDHEKVGAELAGAILTRLHFPRSTVLRVEHLVRNHMFSYEAAWSDAAVRRFITRIGPGALDELFALREADNVGSGVPPATGLAELRRRVNDQLEAHVALTLRDLAINGDDLQRELGLPPGPMMGRVLESLLDQVLADSALNDRPTLLLLAQSMVEDEG
jgi:tRNA nucleotidyltransferase (CCA-adding enzyme)